MLEEVGGGTTIQVKKEGRGTTILVSFSWGRAGLGRPASQRPAGQPTAGRPANGRPANSRPANGRPAQLCRPASGRPASGRPANGRPAQLCRPASGQPAQLFRTQLFRAPITNIIIIPLLKQGTCPYLSQREVALLEQTRARSRAPREEGHKLEPLARLRGLNCIGVIGVPIGDTIGGIVGVVIL